MEYRVAEKFISINGEARKAGETAVFIRFTGCNLRCSYCDTLWAVTDDAPYEIMNLDEIVSYVDASGIKNVTLTGGEPLLQKGIEDLTAELIGHGHRVEVETNGAVSIKEMYELAERLTLQEELSITLDYKCPSSGMQAQMDMDNYNYLRKYDTVKFVVGSDEDLECTDRIIREYNLPQKCAVYINPVFGKIEPRQIVEYLIANRMNGVTCGLQLHKIIWDPDMRGV